MGCNVFWMTNAVNINFDTTLSMFGIFISGKSINVNVTTEILGRLYSSLNIDFIDSTTSNITFECIDLVNYPILNTYAVLATDIIVDSGAIVTISDFYGYTGSQTGTGTIIGTQDAGNAIVALNPQLEYFVNDINAYRATLNVVVLNTQMNNETLYPNINYNNSNSITFNGVITLNAEGDSNAQFFICSDNEISFNNVNLIKLINGASSCNVFWLSTTKINFQTTAPPVIPGIFIAYDSITLFDVPQNISGRKIYKNKFIREDANLLIEPVIWISKFKVIDLNSKSRPICIKKNALGQNYPFKDLYVSPCHSLLLNGKMVLAKHLVNGKTIYQDNDCDSVEYYHLECENHSAIFANGILAESYLDVNNRDVFDNSITIRRNNVLKKYIN